MLVATGLVARSCVLQLQEPQKAKAKPKLSQSIFGAEWSTSVSKQIKYEQPTDLRELVWSAIQKASMKVLYNTKKSNKTNPVTNNI